MFRNGIFSFFSCSIVSCASSIGHASKVKNSASLKRKKLLHPRRGQFVCSSPLEDCGFGLWNEDSCECNCIPPYCFDEIFQSCVLPGSCPDPFEGCALNESCPYFPNPTTGLCESGPSITQGVFEVFRTAEECCLSSYQDISSCVQTPPAASPSPTKQTTESHNATQTFDTAGVLLEPIPIVFDNLPSQFELNDDERGQMVDIVQNILAATAVAFNITILEMEILDGIFSNQGQVLPLKLQVNVMGSNRKIRGTSASPATLHGVLLQVLQGHTSEIADGLKEAWGSGTYTNSTILSIGGAETTSTPTFRPTPRFGVINAPTSPNDGGEKPNFSALAAILSAFLFLVICGGLLVWRRRHDKALDSPLSNDNSFLRGSESSSIESSRVEVDLKISEEDAFSRRQAESDGSRNVNQSRGMNDSLALSRLMHHSSNQSNLMNQSSNQSRHTQKSQSYKTHATESVNGQSIKSERRINQSSNQSCRINQSSNRSLQMDETSNQSRSRMDRRDENLKRVSLDPPEQNNDLVSTGSLVDQNPYQVVMEAGNQRQMRTAGEEEVEDGYDGGKSSFLISRTNALDDEDSSDEDQVFEAEESDDHVLGLLYYAGASSADESEAKKSGKSRRSGRTGRSRYSSGKSKHSSGKSSKTRSKSRRKNATLKKVGKEPDQEQQQQHRYTEAFPRKIASESERQHTHVTKPIAGDKISGSTVYINSMSSDDSQSLTLDENDFPLPKDSNPRAEQSHFSQGSTIRTDDNHRQAFAENEKSRQDMH